MPLYDFKCTSCEHVFEIRQKYKDPSPLCEECDEPTERLISSTSFVLKGGGWYKDGYSKTSD
tara:strand:+ start:111 stop:296 length:186 start_codon:yes stop_codon:yes gene_type:complete